MNINMSVFVILLSALCTLVTPSYPQNSGNNLHVGLTERIGNFSVELLYHTTTQAKQKDLNLIISPITVWNVLAVIAEGASGNTQSEISEVIRIAPKERSNVRKQFNTLIQYLQVKTNTVELQKFNALFVQDDKLPLKDFSDIAKEYDTRMISVNFSNPELTTNMINTAISSITHDKIPTLVNVDDVSQASLLLTSALYFKGQWTIPFNTTFTEKAPFYDSKGEKIGEVNMMYNRYTYPYANIKALQARIIEIPYGVENRLSMLIMLPSPGVTIEQMLRNFATVPLDIIFKELKVSKDEYADDEVDLFLPRFKIESNLVLTDSLKAMGVHDLFDENRARLPYMAFKPLYVSKIIHKAEIEVTEQGTEAAAATAAEFTYRISATRFEANRPFWYLIIEKTTNSITFGGYYQNPSLY